MELFLTLINLKFHWIRLQIFTETWNYLQKLIAENEQNEIKTLLSKLRNYNPTKLNKTNVKKETLSAAKKLLNNMQEGIDAYKTGIFLYIDGFQITEESEEELEESEDEFKKFIEYIENESKSINYDLFKHYFNFTVPGALAKQLYETKIKIKTMR